MKTLVSILLSLFLLASIAAPADASVDSMDVGLASPL